jgi:hypothetical protein
MQHHDIATPAVVPQRMPLSCSNIDLAGISNSHLLEFQRVLRLTTGIPVLTYHIPMRTYHRPPGSSVNGESVSVGLVNAEYISE